MKRITALCVLALSLVSTVSAQDKFFTKNGKISFFSKAPLENIEAHNRSVTCVLDTKTGALQFAVLMKGFQFERALMQEHFNENYLETGKFPKAEFKGALLNNQEIDYNRNGTYNARVKGKLTIHGETRDIETDGKLTVTNGKVAAESEFVVELADFKIKNDKLNNISNTIKVSVDCDLEPLK